MTSPPSPPSHRESLRRSGALAGLAVFFVLLGAGVSHAASLSGRVRFLGEPPERPLVMMGRDPACDRAHPAGIPAETPIVSPDGGLGDAIVYVVGKLPRKFHSPVPQDPVVIDQRGCRFLPHVVGVRVGQELEVRSSDEAVHQVEARTELNTEFRESMATSGLAIRKTFALPEVAVRLKCDLHPWMSAWVGVFDHPFFAVSGADGTFRIDGLPEGDFAVHAWHETLGTTSAAIEVDDEDDALSVELSFAGN